MILYLLLFVLSVPVDSTGRPYAGGRGKVSREFLDHLHRQAAQQNEWTRNIVKLQKTLRHPGSRYGQEPADSNIGMESSFARNDKLVPSPEHFSQHDYGFMVNRNKQEIAHAVELQGINRKSQSTGFLPSFTDNRPDSAGHLPFHVTNYRTDKARGNKGNRKQELIIRIGDDEIRIRPEDYKVMDRNIESKSAVLTNENIPYLLTSLANEPYTVTPNAKNYYSSSPRKSYSSLFEQEPYAASEISTSASAEEAYYHSEYSDLTEQSVDPEFQKRADSRNRSLPTKPEHSKENITQEHPLTVQKNKDFNAQAHEKRREVIINGKPQGKRGIKGSISEHWFPPSISAALESPELQNGTSEESWKLYPPLLIEEVNLPNVKDFEFPKSSNHLNVSELLPGETVIDETGSKIRTPPSGTEVAEIQELELFQIPSSSDGSGDDEPNEEELSSKAADFLNFDADEELIAGRKLTSNSSQTSFLEQEGSGLASFESLMEDVSSRELSPRIIDFFATANDSSTPCTTPKGEPGHCKDIRYCILQEVLNNFNLYLQYVCLIRRRFVGVCCPDNPVISQTQEPDEENSPESTNAQTMEFSQPLKGCGMSMKTRIVGGSVSQPHEWNWMVALLRKNRFFCGGVLVNNWYVLTAAHCTLGVKPRDLKIRLGEYNFLESREHKEDVRVKEIKRHAQFITLTFQHDIALLKLTKPVQFSRFVSSICLPQAEKEPRNVNATVVGWGTVSFGGAASPVLREVTLPVWRNEDCDRTYLFEDINDSFLCAGSPEPNQDACQGDSGGPLMALNGDGRWEAIGIVSWGRRCGDPKYPGVYTRITTYLEWIQNNMT